MAEDIEPYKVPVYDLNDQAMLSELRRSGLPDSGQVISTKKNLTPDDLAAMEEQHSGRKSVHSLTGEQREQVEDFAHKSGLPHRSKNNRTYHYSK